MTEHPNAARVRALYAAFAARDLEEALGALADDAVFHFHPADPGGGPIHTADVLAGDHQGREAIVRALAASFEFTGGSQVLHIKDVFADDDHAVVVLRETATRTDGTTLDMDEAHLVALDADGKVTHLWDLASDPDVHNDFFAGR